MRQANIERKTSETDIQATVNLDGSGIYNISTGIGFLDHMLEQLSRHSLIDINISAKGDLEVDFHHTTEDTGIALGMAVAKALGDRKGIRRFASLTSPMDEALTLVSLDISGRPFLLWDVEFSTERLGEMDTQLFHEWFQAFVQHSGITLHVQNLHGTNSHHIIESCFKGVARSLRIGMEIDPRSSNVIPSTKGTIGGDS